VAVVKLLVEDGITMDVDRLGVCIHDRWCRHAHCDLHVSEPIRSSIRHV